MSKLNANVNVIPHERFAAAQALRRMPAVAGRVTHPTNLQPAIDALTAAGQDWLEQTCNGREVTPRDIARAADFERNEL